MDDTRLWIDLENSLWPFIVGCTLIGMMLGGVVPFVGIHLDANFDVPFNISNALALFTFFLIAIGLPLYFYVELSRLNRKIPITSIRAIDENLPPELDGSIRAVRIVAETGDDGELQECYFEPDSGAEMFMQHIADKFEEFECGQKVP